MTDFERFSEKLIERVLIDNGIPKKIWVADKTAYRKKLKEHCEQWEKENNMEKCDMKKETNLDKVCKSFMDTCPAILPIVLFVLMVITIIKEVFLK